ncbi:MAG TPA: hypothetical protein VGA28_04045 [Desulfurivibrionaceae bacterium]
MRQPRRVIFHPRFFCCFRPTLVWYIITIAPLPGQANKAESCPARKNREKIMSLANRKQYGQFTAVMHREYERAVKKMREELSQGRTYEHACHGMADISQEIQAFVKEDFLKIIIAEEHFGTGIDISDIALLLELPYEKVESARLALLNDMRQETECHPEPRTTKIN